MKKQLKHVEKFHNVFRHPVSEKVTTCSDDRIQLRYKLMKEENEEYLEAAMTDNIVEIADSLGDMLYILCGTILEHGMQDKIEEVFEVIQASNMSKLGENGLPIYREDGKILKGLNYFKPTEHIREIITETLEDRRNIFSQWLEGLNLDELIYSEHYDRSLEKREDLHESETFEGNVEELLGVPWSTVQEYMKEIADFHDTKWYSFINHYLIKLCPDGYTIYKILRDE